MTRSRAIGGGDFGNFLEIPALPDSTFATEIAALEAAGTEVVGKFVSATGSANYQFTSPASDAVPWGRITRYEADADSTYILTIELWLYINSEGVEMPATRIVCLPYGDATIALTNEIGIYSTTYMYAEVSSAGYGYVIAKDVVTGYVDVII